MNYSMRLNSQLPLATRKVFAEKHLNSVKLMKKLNGMWINHRISLAKLAKEYGINHKHISNAFNTWHIFLLGRFTGVKYCDSLPLEEVNRRRFAEANCSRKTFMRLRENTNLSDKEICLLFHIPSRQAPFIRSFFHINRHSIKEQYKRKMVTEYRNNERKYGKGIKNPFQIPAVKEQIRQTNLRKYGVENPHLNPAILAKTLDTLHRRYGANVDNPFQIAAVKDKIQQTVWNRSYGDIKHFKQGLKLLDNVDYINKLMKFLYYQNGYKLIPLKSLVYHNPYLNLYHLKMLFSQEIEKENSPYLFKQYILRGNSSMIEYKFSRLLDKQNIKYRTHIHILPKPNKRFHFDYYLPKYKLLIELNPAYTHQDKDSYAQRFSVGSRNWKFLMAKKCGYTLLNLYSDDFEHNYLKAMIKLKEAMYNISANKQLCCDNVPYRANQNKIEHLRKYSCYTEGYTWWQ